MQAVRIDASGQCTSVNIRVRGKSITCDRRQIHLHHIAESLAILSPVQPQELQSESVKVFPFVMPPPLNAYIYPMPVYIAHGQLTPVSTNVVSRGDAQKEPTLNLSTLSLEEFGRIYTDLSARALRSQEGDVIYDVPAHPLSVEGADDILDIPSDEEVVDVENSDDEIQTEDDEDWELDDDEPPT